ncbi:hypothetical protein CVIRNUC_000908 [Coccomyxa viridis]|uniref:Germin-like protein n=1 Tax=Coccomyxa viridis TaxID=1274662 RepID=A0AAV1HST8_9CHLO|nr:hypothetical protein CVIRNUC_000908 [Coccomyxa viridis]
MMSRMIVVLACLAASALVVSCGENQTTVGGQLEQGGSKAFVYNPVLQGLNGTQGSGGGTSQKRMVGQWPALKGRKISQTVFTLDPCAMRPAHVHQRADGLLYVISGARFVVGFVSEEGKPVVNEISTGASAIFPVGLVHYQQNLDCYTASYTISYNSEDPGTQMTYPSLLALPDSAVAATLGLNQTGLASLKNEHPPTAFVPKSDAECAARCKLGAASAPAPGTVASQSLSG